MLERVALSVLLLVIAACSNKAQMTTNPPMWDFKQVTAEQWNTLSKRTFYFGHQSVGANIVDGVREIAAQRPEIQLRIVSDAPTPAAGVLNEFPIGRNEDPESKNAAMIAATQSALGPLPVVMFKYCFVDVDEAADVRSLFQHYRQTVAAVRSRHPEAVVVHVTLPLATEPSKLRYYMNTVRGIPTTRDANARRNEYNEMLRAAFAGKEPVFDLAAVESTHADGTLEYGMRDGARVPALAPEWSADGAHLNAAGRKHVAEQFLATLATLGEAPVVHAQK
jgi:hypothetical protein